MALKFFFLEHVSHQFGCSIYGKNFSSIALAVFEFWKTSEKRGGGVTLNELCTSIREQVDLVEKQLEVFSFFDHEQSTQDLSTESGAFLWFQLFNTLKKKGTLLNLKGSSFLDRTILSSARRKSFRVLRSKLF